MVGGRPNHSTANIQTLLYPGDGHGVFGSMLRSCSMIKMAYPHLGACILQRLASPCPEISPN